MEAEGVAPEVALEKVVKQTKVVTRATLLATEVRMQQASTPATVVKQRPGAVVIVIKPGVAAAVDPVKLERPVFTSSLECFISRAVSRVRYTSNSLPALLRYHRRFCTKVQTDAATGSVKSAPRIINLFTIINFICIFTVGWWSSIVLTVMYL